jgi:hypothetical protein
MSPYVDGRHALVWLISGRARTALDFQLLLRFGSAWRVMHAIAALIRGPIKVRASFVEALFNLIESALAHGV